MENVAGEQGLALQQLFPYKSSSFLEIQTLIKSHSLMPGASNLAILIFSTFFSQRMKDGNAAITLLEKYPEKNSGFEWDSNP